MTELEAREVLSLALGHPVDRGGRGWLPAKKEGRKGDISVNA